MPLRAIWLATVVSMLLGLLDLASPIEANAIFAIPVMVLDLSYMIPIYLFQFTPGPFYMGPGVIGWVVNIVCISWALFISVIFSLPTTLPDTWENMNYVSVITIGVIILSG
ncbi:hypothetical protein J3A83DRAFT_4186031 [Scleroderma citrinum]